MRTRGHALDFVSTVSAPFTPYRQRHLETILCGVVAILLVFCPGGLCAPGGYEALGYFTYTSLSDSGSPIYKIVMMFDVKVNANKWKIRTEPLIEGTEGIGFYEASLIATNSVLLVSALEAAYNSSESPFKVLRNQLKESKKVDLEFRNHPLPTPSELYDLMTASAGKSPRQPAVSPKVTTTNRINNVAVAVALASKYPPMDPSFTALLWFAFTPPEPRTDGTHKLLPQIWDDGSRPNIPFRRAEWKQFTEPPYLVSSAVYCWVGKQFLPGGELVDIDTSDVSTPLGVAARFDVNTTTNLNGLVLKQAS